MAAAMIGIGALMLASTLLGSWGLFGEGDVAEALQIGALIGGIILSILGFALYRRINRQPLDGGGNQGGDE